MTFKPMRMGSSSPPGENAKVTSSKTPFFFSPIRLAKMKKVKRVNERGLSDMLFWESKWAWLIISGGKTDQNLTVGPQISTSRSLFYRLETISRLSSITLSIVSENGK